MDEIPGTVAYVRWGRTCVEIARRSLYNRKEVQRRYIRSLCAFKQELRKETIIFRENQPSRKFQRVGKARPRNSSLSVLYRVCAKKEKKRNGSFACCKSWGACTVYHSWGKSLRSPGRLQNPKQNKECEIIFLIFVFYSSKMTFQVNKNLYWTIVEKGSCILLLISF